MSTPRDLLLCVMITKREVRVKEAAHPDPHPRSKDLKLFKKEEKGTVRALPVISHYRLAGLEYVRDETRRAGRVWVCVWQRARSLSLLPLAVMLGRLNRAGRTLTGSALILELGRRARAGQRLRDAAGSGRVGCPLGATEKGGLSADDGRARCRRAGEL